MIVMSALVVIPDMLKTAIRTVQASALVIQKQRIGMQIVMKMAKRIVLHTLRFADTLMITL